MLSTLGVAILLLLDGPFQEKLQTLQEQTGPGRPGTFKAFGKSTLKPPTKKAALAPQLDQDSLEEIRKIRDRIGLRLFPGKKNEREFESQLQKLGKEGSFPEKSIENRRFPLEKHWKSKVSIGKAWTNQRFP